jgi:ABC-2 type transport system ATP-binding protein
MSAIKVSDLKKSYGELTAVDGVSFEVARGETFGLLGPNGAGKSTTIGMIVGALRPDHGTVIVDGEADPTRPTLRRRIGVAPQSLALYEELTAEENLAFFGTLYGLSGAHLKARIEWALAFAGLEERRRDRVGTYSGGMQRRLNLVCGLIHDPPVLLMDEPTVGVDPQSRNAIFESIEALKREGRTIVYTTHYMEEAERLCDRVAIMDRGKILALDTVAGLLRVHGGAPTVEIVFAGAGGAPGDPGSGARRADLASYGGDWDGPRWRVRHEHPIEILSKAMSTHDAFSHVSIERANLETVFLHLTGRTLRD